MQRCPQQCVRLRFAAHRAKQRRNQFLGVLAQLGQAVLDAGEAPALRHLHKRELRVVVVRHFVADFFVQIAVTNQGRRWNSEPLVQATHHRHGQLTSARQNVGNPRRRADVRNQVFLGQPLLGQAECDGLDGVD